MRGGSALRLNVDAIEDCNEQVDNQHIGAQQVHRHHYGGHPPAPEGGISTHVALTVGYSDF
jgi:hypothetical protein